VESQIPRLICILQAKMSYRPIPSKYITRGLTFVLLVLIKRLRLLLPSIFL